MGSLKGFGVKGCLGRNRRRSHLPLELGFWEKCEGLEQIDYKLCRQSVCLAQWKSVRNWQNVLGKVIKGLFNSPYNGPWRTEVWLRMGRLKC